ncbi:coiled-coil domain containing 88A isoform X2 [Amia ocellicauda]|uniref:coiled-coil domain containing 88A isoform X2 n=1 Tax=Amia ocellicauda TaxID=2972642 RepID=UPI0034645609
MEPRTEMGESCQTLREFMSGPLVTWVRTFEALVDVGEQISTQYLEVNSSSHDAQGQYLRLVDGVFLNRVMRLIDPNPRLERIYSTEKSDGVIRVQNFSILTRHLRSYYQEDLQQLILMPLPNVAVLGRDPLTEAAVEELRRLLLLLLGCAVQCERKEEFIQQIQSLDIETQAAIATCIQEVTQDPCNVLPLQWGELSSLEHCDLQTLFNSMAQQIHGLLTQRDAHLERIAELSQEQECLTPSTPGRLDASHSLSVQLADSKAKLRRLRQELEDKGEQLLDYKQEVQTLEAELKKLRQENRELVGEVRLARGYRDELDCLRERAARTDRLQGELQSCRDRLQNMEQYRTRLEEQGQYNQSLQETRALLEGQLAEARARCARVRELDRENLLLRQRVTDLEGERDAERLRVDELLEENMGLEAELKHSLGVSQNLHHWEVESDEELSHERVSLSVSGLKPLSEEVIEASSWRLLGAEQENAELRRRLEELQGAVESCAGRESPAHTDLAEVEHLRAELQSQTDRGTRLEREQKDTLAKLQHLTLENSTLREKLVSIKQMQEDERRKGGEPATGTGGGKGGGKLTEKKADKTLKPESREREEGEGEEGGGGEGRQPQPQPSIQEPAVLLESKREAESQAALVLELQTRLEEQRGQARQRQQELEAERERLRQTAEALGEARRKMEALKGESELAGEELRRLHSEVERLRLQRTELAQLREERSQLEREREGLRSSLDSLRAAARKGDQLELSIQTLKAECERLGRSLEAAQRRGEELEAELREAALEAGSLGQGRDQAVLEVRRLEQEKEAVLSQLAGQEREQRQREREVARLRQQLESTASALEHSTQRACSLETDNRRLQQDVCRLQEEQVQLEGLQTEVHELRALRTQHQSSLANLTQELVSEKVRSQELANQVQQLSRELEKAGRGQEVGIEGGGDRRPSGGTPGLLPVLEGSQPCGRVLTPSPTPTHQPQDKRDEDSTGMDLTDREPTNTTGGPQTPSAGLDPPSAPPTQETVPLSSRPSPQGTGGTDIARLVEQPQKPDKLHQDKIRNADAISCRVPQTQEVPDGRELPTSDLKVTPDLQGTASTPLKVEGTPGIPHPTFNRDAGPTLTFEPQDRREPLSARLIEVERKNASLQAERDALGNQLAQSQQQCGRLQEQVDTLQRHALTLQDSSTALLAHNTTLQVERATLLSQHAALQSRCSEAGSRVAALEAEGRGLVREKEELRGQWEGLRRDHAQLTTLHQRQEVELEELTLRHTALKTAHRQLDIQHRELEGRYGELCGRWTALEEGEAGVRAERERLVSETQTHRERERELERLREDNIRLATQQRESAQVQTELCAQASALRGELGALQLDKTRLETELNSLREQNQNLDITSARLSSQYQLLTQLKGTLEEENRALVEQNQSLGRENRALLERSLQSRDQHHQQQREYMDKLNELRREKQKLVEKIMDQYRVLEPNMPVPSKAKKGNWITDRMKRLMKPRGREGREPLRAHFIAAGSVENLAQGSDLDQHPLSTDTQDPRSAPVSPSPLRKATSSVSVCDDHHGPQRAGRHKLSSRYPVSMSFSPGDVRPTPRQRFRQRGTSVHGELPAEDSPPSRDSLTSLGEATEEEKVSESSQSAELNSDKSHPSSGAEDCQSRDQSPVTKKNSLPSH